MSEPAERDQWWTGALVAGLVGGLGDGLAAVRHLLLAPDPERDAILMGVSLASGVLVAGIAGALLPPLLSRLGPSIPRSRWSAFVAGAAAWTAVCVAAQLPGWWSMSAVLVLGAIPLFANREPGRPRMVVALGFLALLAVQVADDDRPRDRQAAPSDPGPDVLWVVVEGLRADQVDRQPQGDLAAMPELVGLASTGIRFSRASTPVTTREGALRAVVVGQTPWSDAPVSPWGRELRAMGWRTGIFGGPESREVAQTVGFAVQDVDPGWLAGRSAGAPGKLWERWMAGRSGRRSARRVVEAWERWLDTLPDERPAVAVLTLSDLTWPTVPTPPWDTAFERRSTGGADGEAEGLGRCSKTASAVGFQTRSQARVAYDGVAASVDALLPRIWARASARPRGTLMVVVGSRGTPMGEEGRWLDAAGGVDPAEVQIPLVVVGGTVPPGSVLGAPVSSVDLVASLRAQLGLPATAEARPVPGLVRGYPPRSMALSVGGEGTVVAMTPNGMLKREQDGALFRLAEDGWEALTDEATVTVPILAPIEAPAHPCDTADTGGSNRHP